MKKSVYKKKSRFAKWTKQEKIVLSNIIRMAKELEITSLCEGVETEQQSDFLKEIGCDIQQGYYFARPLCEDDFSNMLGA